MEVGNVDQAAIMAEGGINDIVIAHPFYGERKLEKVKNLLNSKPETIENKVQLLGAG